MRDTTQAELMEIAQKHLNVAAVQSLLLSIHEAQTQARVNLMATLSGSASLVKAAAFEEGYRVGYDHSDFVATASKASAALSRISTLLTTLASVLGSLGEEVSY